MSNKPSIDGRLVAHPALRLRFERILALAENADNEVRLADDAEDRVTAAPLCDPADAAGWLAEQQGRLKANQWRQVLTALLPHREAPDVPDGEAPVRACYRYLRNRTHQLNYRDALEQELPIGSGEIESAHRYVVQRRMKIAGRLVEGGQCPGDAGLAHLPV